MKNRAKWLMVALAMTGVAGGVVAQTSSSSGSSGGASAGTPGAHHWKHHGMMAGGGLLHALRQLNLTPAQQQSVHTILTAARSQFAAERKAGGGPDFAALSNPGDPNYATAKQELQTRIANHIQEQTQTEEAIYKVLTTEQQQQLPGILASMKARMGQHAST